MTDREFLRAKIHRATVTDTNPDYDGSITVGDDLLTAADIVPYERVQVVNVTTGSRLETYTIAGPSGTIGLNGAAAHRASRGDTVILIAYARGPVEDQPTPTVVHASESNEVERTEQKELEST